MEFDWEIPNICDCPIWIIPLPLPQIFETNYFMKKIISILTLTLAISLTSCQHSAKNAPDPAAETTQTAKITDSVLTPESLMEQGKNLVDQTVEIKGKVAHVCKHAGKKCSIVGENPDLSIQVMAGGEIERFTPDMIGSEIKVKGTVKERKITKDILADQEKALDAAKKGAKTEEAEKHCSHSMHNLNLMKKWMSDNQMDYYPIYYIEGTSFEFVEE